MTTGLLWYDESKERTLEQKLERAVDRFWMKHEVPPSEIHANPRTIGEERVTSICGVNVSLKHNKVLEKDYLWMSRKEVQ